MSVVLGEKKGNTVTFTMDIDGKEFKKAINEAYNKNKHYFSVPGFRKGRVPRQIIELNYGKEIFHEEALNSILPKIYEDAVDELGLDPVDMPEIEVKDEIQLGKDFVVTATVVVKPEVKLGDYKALEIEEVKAEVTEEDLEDEIKGVQEMNARIVPVEDRKSEMGDIVDIDFKGYVNEEAFPGGEAEHYELELGSASFIPGFEDQLVGKEKGEEVEVKVTFPEDYGQEDLAGKEAKFMVTINEIKVKELPELDDEFVKDISEFDTMEEYKEDVRKNLVEKEEENAKNMNINNIVDKLVEDAEMELPEVMVEAQVESEINDFGYRLQMQGITLDQYMQLTGNTLDGFKLEVRPVAEKRVRANLVIDAIAKAESIEATDEDVDRELDKIAAQYNQDDVEKFKEDMKKGNLDYLYEGITREKTIDFILENVKFI